jgi:hypothetical protein
VWHKPMEDLNTWMKNQKTHPGIRAAVIKHLTAWQEAGELVPPLGGQTFFDLPTATRNQNEVGWQAANPRPVHIQNNSESLRAVEYFVGVTMTFAAVSREPGKNSLGQSC